MQQNTEKPLKVLMVASECVPFASTGGMGDVTGALPAALQKLGADIRVVMPKYGSIDARKHNITLFQAPMGVWMGNREEWCSVHKALSPQGVPVYFVEHNQFFDREGLYHDDGFNDYQDNPKRFAFLSRAALQLCQEIHFSPDIVHANDWQTAFLPAYLKIWHKGDPVLGKAASVLTIHNLAYQGRYSREHFAYTGLGDVHFTPDKFECYGAMNILKGGIHFADAINTVSPGYARETLTTEGGFGLDTFLLKKGNRYTGILNGADYSQWNPETDKLIPERYSPARMNGKAACKSALQKKFSLARDPSIPVIGIVSRFTWQKGLDLLADCINKVLEEKQVQLVVLGTGDKHLESLFGKLPGRFPGKAGSHIGFSNELAHLIEAGSDFFLMPSVYEPCGLNQIYSMKYGTIPIVRATGGLDDTVETYDPDSGRGTGFKFLTLHPDALYDIILQALDAYYHKKEMIRDLMRNGMQQHYSWDESAAQYMDMYRKAMALKSS